ncbi:phytanoyl-CoA dioxygenase family protein [Paenibacillus cymbidii]|uniref:phytanoyl-CoA dioxygenase family protein n=1 Tax=Paenibacillus cymbidii TaxID=1639034 RepID=UPI001081BC7A|nr:phytanoyl-CoA dioxygenase family protein [Paenibacillus cymbidii]
MLTNDRRPGTMLEADAARQSSITDEQKQFFLDNGFLVIRNVLRGKELADMQAAMMELVNIGAAGVENDPDFMYGIGMKSGNQVLKRIEYVIQKRDPAKVLLGHPFILSSVEKVQGANFIPTWDSMVLKMPDEGIIVPWHRDSEPPEGCDDPRPIFNVDFYMDDADLSSCLWVIPGSNKWTKEDADARCQRAGFDTSDAIPVPLNAGDVIFHDIKVLHGSPSGDGNPLRRTVYYEFRPGEIELEFGPHVPEYLPLKQQVLLDCIERRKAAEAGQGEMPFSYQPTGHFAVAERVTPPTHRYPHMEYWRKSRGN